MDGVVDFDCVAVGAAGAVEFDLVVGLVVGVVAEVDEAGHFGCGRGTVKGSGGWVMEVLHGGVI